MFSILLTILAILGVAAVAVCVWFAISSARTPQGAAAWAVFLVSAPWFAVPAFLVFGRRKLRDYRAAWRKARAKVREVPHGDVTEATPEPRRGTLSALEAIGGLPFVGGNAARLLIDGEATFDAICAAIDAARHTVCLQFYIIRDDGLGRRVEGALVRAAERGVRVFVMYDGVGSQKLSARWPASLRSVGVKVLNPETTRGPTSRLDINFRNHRKTVVVDGEIAFTGGHNIGDEYLGLDPTYGPWRDTHLELRGPVARQLQTVFAEDWHWASGETLDLSSAPPSQPAGDLPIAYVPTGPGDTLDGGSLMFVAAITAATDRVWIASPYFVPDTEVLSALSVAALAGRDVRLLLPEVIDHYLPWLAAHAYFDEVRAAGVKIYRYQPGFMHQKVILVDEDLAAVGTTNLDNRSFRLNFEAMAFVHDRSFAAEVEQMLLADFDRSEVLVATLADQRARIRYGAPLARLLAPIL